MSSAPEAFLLLTLPDVTLTAPNTVQTGVLALECVTVAVPSVHNPTAQAHASPVNRDVYLVLRLNAFETPIDPARVVVFNVSPTGVRTYTFQGTQLDPRVLTFTIAAKPKGEEDPNLTEDLETFQSIIAQYAELRGGPAPTSAPLPTGTHPHDLRGHLVLINEDSGEIIGEVDTDRRFTIQEDATLAERGREDDPVVLDIPDGAANATESHPLQLFVSFIPPGQEDWITKGATIISHAISMTTNLLLTSITTASTSYIANSTPSTSTPPTDQGKRAPPPRALVFLSSPSTRMGLTAVHAVSGQAVRVSSKTVSMIDSMIRRAMGGKENSPKAPSGTAASLSPSPVSGPPLPPRSASLVPPPAYSRADEKPTLPHRATSPALPSRSASPLPPMPPPLPPRLGTKARMLLSADLILSTLEHSAKSILEVGGEQLSAVIGHKYGAHVGQNALLLTGTARNVALVYIDMRGIARKALLKRAGNQWVKNHVRSSSRQNESGPSGH